MVAPVHLEFFDSIAGIARAKYELIESLHAGGIAVLNADDEYVSQFGRDFHGKVVTFGLHKPADVSAQNIESRGPLGSAFDIVVDGETVRGLRCRCWASTTSITRWRGLPWGCSMECRCERRPNRWPRYQPVTSAEKSCTSAGATIINDCYNSNPKALDSMVRSLAQIPAQRRIVVAGEMLELGPAGEAMHRDCGRHMAQATASTCCWACADWRRPWSKARSEAGMRRRVCEHAGRGRRVAAARGQSRATWFC